MTPLLDSATDAPATDPKPWESAPILPPSISGHMASARYGLGGNCIKALLDMGHLEGNPKRPGHRMTYPVAKIIAAAEGIESGRIVLPEHIAHHYTGPRRAPREPMPIPAPEPVIEVVPTVIPDPWEDLDSALNPFGEVALHAALKDAPGSTVLTKIGSADAITLDQVRKLVDAATALFEARR